MDAVKDLNLTRAAAAVAVAAVLWFVMFSPWTAAPGCFWWLMSASGVILSALALRWGRPWGSYDPRWWLQLAFGVAVAVVMWGVFWVGDKVSGWMFDFARPGVDSIYSLKTGLAPGWIAVLLLLVIGPAEELFWRGYAQRVFSARWGAWKGFLVTWACYTLIHVWSFNFMLVAAAAVCGFGWGILYRLFPRMLPGLIVSHALWDAAAFVVFPF